MLLAERSFRRTVAGCRKNSSVVPGTFTRIALIVSSYLTAVDTVMCHKSRTSVSFMNWPSENSLMAKSIQIDFLVLFSEGISPESYSKEVFWVVFTTLLTKFSTLLHDANSNFWENSCYLTLRILNNFWLSTVPCCWQLFNFTNKFSHSGLPHLSSTIFGIEN